jgi:mono/diheme cytochrome c family protein
VKRAAILLAASLALAACSLAGDVTPPPGLATAQAQGIGIPATSAPLKVPPRPPDLAAGERIFSEKCAPCHGASGDGQGPQAAALPNPPAALAAASFAQSAIPQEWYRVVTEGRIESFMPGFISLDDGQRWDVVGYALTLGQSPEELETGRVLYQQNCRECHGDLGRGTGDVPDLAEPEFLAGRSLLSLFSTITEGGQAMPRYAETLSEAERWALAAYVRSLALTPGGTPPTASAVPSGTEGPTTTGSPVSSATVEASPPATTSLAGQARIEGKIDNGTAGSAVPAGLEVTLHGFDGGQESLTVSQPVGANGRFAFEGVAHAPGRVFVATTDYQNVLYASEIGQFASGEPTLELPLTIYESTEATDQVEVSRLHMVFDFPTDDLIQVVELWLLSNLGDRTVAGGESGAIEIALPEGASGLSLDGGTVGDRFELTAEGFRDRRELVPGANTGELVFSYILPYDGSREIVRRSAYPVAATVAMVTGEGARLDGDGFVDTGVREVTGARLRSYERGPAQGGEDITLTLRGRPRPAGGPSQAAPLALGAAALLLAVIGAALIWFRPRLAQRPAGPPAGEDSSDVERTLWAIASLDNEYAAGKLDSATYQARRSELVRRAEAADRD